MSRNLIQNPSFEAATISPWQTSGEASQEPLFLSFEGDQVAFLGTGFDPENLAILSQLFLVPSNGSHLYISWSMLGTTFAGINQLTIELQWFGSANDGLPPLRFDTIFVKAEGALLFSDRWQTAVVATAAKPSGTVWARIRFILDRGVNPGPALIDNVVVTAERNMSGNLIQNPSFEAVTLSPWQTSGQVSQEFFSEAFEGDEIALLGSNDAAPGDLAIISQLFLVPSNGSHLHISWSMFIFSEPPQLTIELQWFGSANDRLPPLRFDTIFVRAEGAFTNGWETAVVATGAKPSGTVWARIRFILEQGVNPGTAAIDNVVVTAETS